MKRNAFIIILMAVIPLVAPAQEMGFRGRTEVAADWKVAKGVHLDLGYEIRSKDSFKAVDKHLFSLGASYKPVKWLKFGATYTFIDKNSSNGWRPSHRVSIDATGSLKRGAWQFSLRERLIYKHKTHEINPYQEVRNSLSLRSRFKVAYKTTKGVDPYVFFELANCLNAPSFSATYNQTTGAYTDYKFLGYKDVYINKIRTGLGVNWNIDRMNSIDFGVLIDYDRKKKIDTNKEGTRLKGLEWKKGWITSLCIAYKFSF